MDELTRIGSVIMSDLDRWFNANLLTLNTDKSFFCIFRRRTKIRNIPDKINFNNKSISRTANIKYLGIIIDDFLIWNNHISYLCKSLKSFFSVFYNIRDYLFLENCKTIYYTMVYSKIRYGICVYGFAKNESTNKLQVLQNKLLKVLTGKEMRYSTSMLHNDLHILQVKDILAQEIASFVNKYLNNKLPTIFAGYYTKFCDIHHYNTRGSTNTLSIPKYKSEIGKKTVKVNGCTTWNELSNEIKSIENQKSFKKAIKEDILPYSTS